MKTATAPAIALAIALLLAGPDATRAESPDRALLHQQGCSIAPDVETDLLRDRAGVLSHFQSLPAQCLKDLVLQCSDTARGGLLDLGSAALCSIGYEALLAQGFRGDFTELVAWWRQARTSVN